jgi:CheY-like chemotaxis protein
MVHFEVEDTGIGIHADQFEEIFLPFQQVGEKRSSVEGTGLGLSISRKLVRLMGGELMVKSTVGKGSVFGFDLQLPIVEGIMPSAAQPAQKIIGYKGPQRTVLIADDRQENRAVLVNMLSPLGFKIVEAENGQECLEKALQCKPDAILLDLRMPVMDGFETVKQIRQRDKLPMVIIAVSASVYKEVRARSLQAGCDAFLTKPVELETILDILQTQLQLAWVYAEEPEALIPLPGKSLAVSESAHGLPEEQVRMLIELASKGRAKKLLQALADLEKIAQGQYPILEELRQFAKNFQFQEVITRLTRGRGA